MVWKAHWHTCCIIKIESIDEECTLKVNNTHFCLGVHNVAAAESGLGVEVTVVHLHDINIYTLTRDVHSTMQTKNARTHTHTHTHTRRTSC